MELQPVQWRALHGVPWSNPSVSADGCSQCTGDHPMWGTLRPSAASGSTRPRINPIPSAPSFSTDESNRS
jgi:hypothetical protein